MKRCGAGTSKYEAKIVQAYILVSLRKSIICHLWTRLKLTLATDGVRASQAVLVIKNLPAVAGDIRDTDSMPGSGRSPGGSIATHSSILAWRIPWTEEPGRPQSMGLQRVRDD